MDKTLELYFEQTYLVRLADTGLPGEDERSRQEMLAACKAGEPVYFKRDHSHPNKSAILVIRENGQKIGYVLNEKRLARHIDRGGELQGKIKHISGGPTLIQRLLKLRGKKHSASIEIIASEIDTDRFDDIFTRDHEIARIIARAESHQRDNTRLAIKNYKLAIDKIVENDENGLNAKAWRRSKVPVNVLSMIYEQQNKLKESLDIINWYLDFDDYRGIDKYDYDMILKRKKRLEKKLLNH